MKIAIGCFEKAIEIDPLFPLANCGLADSHTLLSNYGLLEPELGAERARPAALRALELDDELAEAHVSYAGVLYGFDWDYPGAERELRRAIELNPSYALAHHWLSVHVLLLDPDRYDEAYEEIRRALELDPLSNIIRTASAAVLWYAHRYDEAVQELKDGIEAAPDYFNFHDYLGMVLVSKQRFEEGITEMQKAVDLTKGATFAKADLGYAFARAGRKEEALRILEELKLSSARNYVNPAFFAEIFAGLGNREEAMLWLEKSSAERGSGLPDLVASPIFDDVRSDSRFVAILGKIGIG
jgi:Tfp pilus assembly protein PilF